MFSRNLRLLIQDEPSISALCRKLGLNRSQFNRYLSGEASPRPVILRRICDYFGQDARILLEPLNDDGAQETREQDAAMTRFFGGHLTAPSQHSVPDGLYAEWKFSLSHPGQIHFHLARIFTDNGVRRLRIKCLDPLLSGLKSLRKGSIFNNFTGLLFRQSNGFASLDRGFDSEVVAFTAYRVGHGVNKDIFPGVKLCGASYAPMMLNSAGPVFLEKIPDQTADILSVARTPTLQPADRAPAYVKRLLDDISTNSFMSSFQVNWPPVPEA